MARLQVLALTRQYEGRTVLDHVSFEVADEEILVILGPSGSGKTTLLRLIAGLEPPDEGRVLLDGQDVTAVPPHRRRIGMMFQEYALFPHLNIFENVAFGLRMQQLPEPEIRARVRALLEQVGLPGYERRDVHTLSGGEKQRVALARSLAPRPAVLLLDEPLGSLDRALREQLMGEIRSLLKAERMTALYVTHDQAEAMAIADRVLILHQGRIEQIAAPEELYRDPATPFVARFLDVGTLLEGRILTEGDPAEVETPVGKLWGRPRGTIHAGMQAWVLLPHYEGTTRILQGAPYDESEKPSSLVNVLDGQVLERRFRGLYVELQVQVAGGMLRQLLPAGSLRIHPGQSIRIHIPADAVRIWPRDAEHARSPG